jgi:DNA (cytosine-5)-methyltransferase 1
MRCLELFAGAGGAAIGLEDAGIEHAALCEWNKDACATLRAAGLGPVVQGDVRDLDAIAAVAGENIDLLWSSFPCQAWSTAGKRKGKEDDRNGWPWTVDALDRFTPSWFLGENVRGLLLHRTTCQRHKRNAGRKTRGASIDPTTCPGCYFELVVLPDLQARFAHVGWWLLDAADFGVPQHRRRVILWAGPAPLVEPTPTHGPGRARPWVSMRKALGLQSERPGVYAGKPSPTVICKERNGARAAWSVSSKRQGGFELASDALYLITGRRRLTIAECARLQDFPADHPWRGSATSRYTQIGNAVPPQLAYVVATALLLAEGSHVG